MFGQASASWTCVPLLGLRQRTSPRSSASALWRTWITHCSWSMSLTSSGGRTSSSACAASRPARLWWPRPAMRARSPCNSAAMPGEGRPHNATPSTEYSATCLAHATAWGVNHRRAKAGQDWHFTQLKIAARARWLLRPGGRLVYSTCSLDPMQNEAVVASLLLLGGLELLDAHGMVRDGLLPGTPSGASPRPGLLQWDVWDASAGEWQGPGAWAESRAALHPTLFPPPLHVAQALKLEKCLRCFPTDFDTAAVFVAVFRRTEGAASCLPAAAAPYAEWMLSNSKLLRRLSEPPGDAQRKRCAHRHVPHEGVSEDLTAQIRLQTGCALSSCQLLQCPSRAGQPVVAVTAAARELVFHGGLAVLDAGLPVARLRKAKDVGCGAGKVFVLESGLAIASRLAPLCDRVVRVAPEDFNWVAQRWETPIQYLGEAGRAELEALAQQCGPGSSLLLTSAAATPGTREQQLALAATLGVRDDGRWMLFVRVGRREAKHAAVDIPAMELE